MLFGLWWAPLRSFTSAASSRLGDLRARPADDDGLDRLAPLLVRDADDRGGRHPGMRGEHVLDLAREDVEPTRDDHVLLAVDDVEEPLVVAPRDVSGVQPAVREQLGRLLGLLPVAGRRQGPAHADLARLAVGNLVALLVEQRHVYPRDRAPAGGEPLQVLRVVVLLAQHRDRHRALGLAVELEEDRAELVDRLRQPGGRHGRRTVEHRLQAGEIGLVEVRVIHAGRTASSARA